MSPSDSTRGTVFLTGADGFTGRYVARALAGAGYCVHDPAIRAGGFDLTHPASVAAAMVDVTFDYVVHLAAMSFVAHDDALVYYAVNTVGTQNLLQAVSQLERPLRRVILASSANVYGNVGGEAIDEGSPPAPVNHYACSKLAMEHIAHSYTPNLPIVVVRPFNYTGVGQPARFLVPKLVSHFARRAPKITLGNLDVVRDFSDVRWVAETYVRLLDAPDVQGTFNLCSGIGRSLRWVVDTLTDLTQHRIEIDVDPRLVRSSEVRQLIGSGAKLDSSIETPKRPDFYHTLGWMLEAATKQASS